MAAKYDLAARLDHWGTIASVAVLGASGWYIASPTTCPLFGSMDSARWWHFAAMWIFTALSVFHVFHFVVTRRWTTATLKLSDFKNFGHEIKTRFLLLGKQDGRFATRYGPLEKMGYEFANTLKAGQIVTGAALWFWSRPTGVPAFDGAMQWVVGTVGVAQHRALHLLFAWLFLAFVVSHVYFVIAEDWRSVLNMTVGKRHLSGKPE